MTTKTQKPAIKESKFNFKTIKSFEDACKKENIDPLLLPDVSMIPEQFRSAIINVFKLMIIFKAINNGWTPDWSNTSEYKYYPWFWFSPSGVGFSGTTYLYARTDASVGSRLCTDTIEKAEYIAKMFENEYKEYYLYL